MLVRDLAKTQIWVLREACSDSQTSIWMLVTRGADLAKTQIWVLHEACSESQMEGIVHHALWAIVPG